MSDLWDESEPPWGERTSTEQVHNYFIFHRLESSTFPQSFEEEADSQKGRWVLS